jgi:hypothetical protein
LVCCNKNNWVPAPHPRGQVGALALRLSARRRSLLLRRRRARRRRRHAALQLRLLLGQLRLQGSFLRRHLAAQRLALLPHARRRRRQLASQRSQRGVLGRKLPLVLLGGLRYDSTKRYSREAAAVQASWEQPRPPQKQRPPKASITPSALPTRISTPTTSTKSSGQHRK